MCLYVQFEKDITSLPLAKHALGVDFPVPEMAFDAPCSFLHQVPLRSKDRHLDQVSILGGRVMLLVYTKSRGSSMHRQGGPLKNTEKEKFHNP